MAAKVKGDLGIPDVLVNNAGSYYLQVGRTQDCFTRLHVLILLFAPPFQDFCAKDYGS